MRTHRWLCTAGWLVVMTGIAASLGLLRTSMVARLSRPESLARWREWRAETERQNQSPGPVQRRTAAGDEPPALVLLRDHFAVIVATSMLVGSFLFAFLAFIARGIYQDRARRKASSQDQRSGEHRS
ncbi:MAG: hypothetical protein ACREJM_10090 [Candidatus Saccharimonadales bacterium]